VLRIQDVLPVRFVTPAVPRSRPEDQVSLEGALAAWHEWRHDMPRTTAMARVMPVNHIAGAPALPPTMAYARE
jgi:hypothetical protein